MGEAATGENARHRSKTNKLKANNVANMFWTSGVKAPFLFKEDRKSKTICISRNLWRLASINVVLLT